MARRQRCVSCWKLFTPNYRNRTKVTARQRVCSDCGSMVGHRFADQRYRASHATPRRVARDLLRSSAGAVSDAVGPPVSTRSGEVAPRADLARQVRNHLAAIAALVDPSTERARPEHGGPPDGCEPSRPLPIRILAAITPRSA